MKALCERDREAGERQGILPSVGPSKNQYLTCHKWIARRAAVTNERRIGVTNKTKITPLNPYEEISMNNTSTAVCQVLPEVQPSYAATSSFRMLDVEEVAELLNCSIRHVYRQVDGGTMSAPVKIGGINRWPVKGIEDWIATGCPAARKIGRG